MSLDATRWAWQQQITATQKLVLLSLADRADENHQCYPSTKRLENDTGLYRETIFEAIKKMEESGLLNVTRSLGKGNKFVLIGVSGRHETSSKKPTGTSSKNHTSMELPTSSEMPTTTSMELPTTQSVNADYHQSVNADTESTIESTKNQSTESTNKRKQKNNPIDLLKNISNQVALDFIEIRKAKNLPITQTALDGIEREAKKLSYTLEQALVICCERGWGGFNANWILKEINDNKSGKNPNKAEFQKATTDLARARVFGDQPAEKEVIHEA